MFAALVVFLILATTVSLAASDLRNSLRTTLRKYDGASVNSEWTAASQNVGAVDFAGTSWATSLEINASRSHDGLETVELRASAKDQPSAPVSVGINVMFPNWSRQHYLIFPGAVYAGNRFETVEHPYPPLAPSRLLGLETPTFIADIPRLQQTGRSRIQLLAGDMAWPACGVFDPIGKRGWLLMAPSHTPWGEIGFDFEEDVSGGHAKLTVMAPGVREHRYSFHGGTITTGADSPDGGIRPAAGDELVVTLEVAEFACDSLAEFFHFLFSVQRATAARADQPAEWTFSAMHRLIEEHYNRDFWWEDAKLYRTGPGQRNPYQTGWCGGLIAEFALFANTDNAVTRARCLAHLEQALTSGVAGGGLFYGQFNGTSWVADHLRYESRAPEQINFTLTRRQGDALLYLLKAFSLMDARGESVPRQWEEVVRRHAEVLCSTWRQDRQFGQFLDQTTNRVVQGNSASGAIIPGALALAHARYGDPEFLAVAREAAIGYHEDFLARGLTTGGPSDAAQAPDSESCAALMESYGILFDQTGDRIWLDHLAAAAHQFSTWVMPYNFPFPEETEFARLGMRTVGTVFANAQNKHSAPGICTHAGTGLLTLFRATGDIRYLELLRDVARAIPQFMSREDRPIHASNGRAMPSGWINERVNVGDWDRNVGGVFYGPCWSEVSGMLTYAELPGVYVQLDRRIVVALDNVEAAWGDDGSLEITNPTSSPAHLRLLVETDDMTSLPLGAVPLLRYSTIDLPAGQTMKLSTRNLAALAAAQKSRWPTDR